MSAAANPLPATLTGHLWTLRGYLRRSVRPPRAPDSQAWATRLDDPDLGPIRLTGQLSHPAGARALVVLVHGLAGCCDSPYVLEAAGHCDAAGLACLRLNLRGADRSGEDIYHAGLAADLVAALASPQVTAFERTAVLGFSLGGHVALRLAIDSPSETLAAVAAVSPPLDLAATATTIDGAGRWIYRQYLLARLLEVYARVADRRRLAATVTQVKRARTFVEFDSLVIAPRYGFADAWDYYRRVSVGPDLSRLRLPALIVGSRADPMIPAASLLEPLAGAGESLRHHWAEPGGHLSFASDLDLGYAAEQGLYPQTLGWLRKQLAV